MSRFFPTRVDACVPRRRLSDSRETMVSSLLSRLDELLSRLDEAADDDAPSEVESMDEDDAAAHDADGADGAAPRFSGALTTVTPGSTDSAGGFGGRRR